MNKQQRFEIGSTYRVRFSTPRVNKEIGRGGKEISRTWAVFKEGAANEHLGSVRQAKLREEPGFYPAKLVQGAQPGQSRWLQGPRFDEAWQAVEWIL